MTIQTIDRGTAGDTGDKFRVGVALDTCQANDNFLDSSKAPKTSPSFTGDVELTSTPARIKGNFSSTSSTTRARFQTTTANGNTVVSAMPAAGGSESTFSAYSSDTANSSYVSMSVNQFEASILTGKTGTGSNLALGFYCGAGQSFVIDPATAIPIFTQGIRLPNSSNVNPLVFNYFIRGDAATVPVGATTAGTTSGGAVGRFERMADTCILTINGSWGAHTGTGGMRITGLPFTAAHPATAIPKLEGVVVGANIVPFAAIATGGTWIDLFAQNSATGVVSTIAITACTSFSLTIVYRV